jgi:hypothetical protein
MPQGRIEFVKEPASEQELLALLKSCPELLTLYRLP